MNACWKAAIVRYGPPLVVLEHLRSLIQRCVFFYKVCKSMPKATFGGALPRLSNYG
jgi:hypothetical protein